MYKFSIIEADILSDIEFECASEDDGLLLRVCLEGAGTIRTGGVEKEYFANMILAIQMKRYAKTTASILKGDKISEYQVHGFVSKGNTKG